MKVSRELYQEMQNQTAPKTKSYYTIPMAFLIGGFICTLGELLRSHHRIRQRCQLLCD